MPGLFTSLRRARLKFTNRRRAHRTLPPFVVVSLDGEIVEFPQLQPDLPIPPFLRRFVPLPQGATNLSNLRRAFEQLALDPRVKGVVLKIACVANPSIYQSLRTILQIFRASGKHIVAYAETLSPFHYYLACACDQIIMPPPAEWNVVGFANEYVFLKDALDRVGVGVDVVNVSPFKSAGDQFARNDFSAESRAQAEWLLDARYDELVRGIAEGRKLSVERVKELIDTAPMSAEDAVKHGLLDDALYEDELESFLLPNPPASAPARPKENALLTRIAKLWPKLGERIQQALTAQLKSQVWIALTDAGKTLLLPDIQYGEKYVGVVSIEGLIVPGNSRRSPLPIPIFGGEVAGSNGVAQAIRKAEADPNLAAVVLYVDSQGGSALASDLMAREIKRLATKKPVVAYMGGVAASGGYYVSALAHHIVAQPLTVTGSIGVILIKPHLDGAYGKFDLHRTTLQRGKNASLFDDTPLNDEERQVIARTVARSYAEFKHVVAEGRKLPVAELEPVCGGRVWTGAQAYEHKLVDTLGDFPAALEKARELANLPKDKRIAAVLVTPPRKPTLPTMFPVVNPATFVFNQLAEVRQLFSATRSWAVSMWGTEKL